MNKQEKVLISTLWDYLVVADEPQKADVIIAFGGIDLEVPKKSAELYKNGFATKVVATGGAGKYSSEVYSDKPEAEVFAEIMTDCGVSKKDILVESKASNTGENVELSMRILNQEGITINSAILIARPFLMRRVIATFQMQFPHVELIACPPYQDIDIYLASAGGRAKGRVIAEIERIKEFPAKGYMKEQVIPDEVLNAATELGSL